MRRSFTTVLAAAWLCSPAFLVADEPAPVQTDAGFAIYESESFRITCPVERTTAAQPTKLLELCEALRGELQQRWFEQPLPTWQVRGDIVLHRTRTEYARYLGPGSERTSGCTTIEVNDAGISVRRLDIRLDSPGWERDVLPHELAHVVLADRFPDKPMPAWASEGIAVLLEGERKLAHRNQELLRAWQARQVPYASHLLLTADNPHAYAPDAFYGQSARLAGFLCLRETSPRFLDFVAQCDASGHDKALLDVYGIHSRDELDRLLAQESALIPADALDIKSRIDDLVAEYQGKPSPQARAIVTRSVSEAE
ncbi:MAG TPA: hypothetical protein VHB77_09730 [Planctomycetaceae bacterium]|nr:hypothetical protein [Planctomycetaceae bacterium]